VNLLLNYYKLVKCENILYRIVGIYCELFVTNMEVLACLSFNQIIKFIWQVFIFSPFVMMVMARAIETC